MLAQLADPRQQVLQGMNERFNTIEPDISHDVTFVVIMVAGLLGLAWILQRRQRRARLAGEIHPRVFLRKVMRKLQLSWGQRLRLWDVARVLNLEQPTAVLISEPLFKELAEQYCQSKSLIGDRNGVAGELEQIRRRLFRAPSAV